MDSAMEFLTNPGPSQMERLCPSQVMNNAGGFVWAVDDLKRFTRFLCLGTEGGTYYVKEQELLLENAKCLSRIVESNRWSEALEELVKCSTDGRAAKQNPTMFALAFFCRQDRNNEMKQKAYKALGDICRIPTHLFQFLQYCEKLSVSGRGWGRGHRKAIINWYLKYEDNPLKLAMHVTKYKNRNGWTHLDVLRMSHPKPKSDGIGAVIRYVVKGLKESEEMYLTDDSSEQVKKLFAFLNAVETVGKSTEPLELQSVANLVKEHHLVREHIPNNLLDNVLIWQTLLPHMPMTALIRNLNKMTQLGLMNDGSKELDIVIRKLGDETFLKQAKIHPFNVLVALNTYSKGRGEKGKLTWTPSDAVVQALDEAFYKCFKFVEPTNQRYLLALDVSGSMEQPVLGSSIDAREAVAAMAMVTFRTESSCDVIAFSDELVPVKLNDSMNLSQVLEIMNSLDFGDTDCSLPMLWAKANKKEYDIFVVYTDSETWCGDVQPAVALKEYRVSLGIPDAKLIVVAMTATDFTIADPEDGRMLDICGFDSAAPEVMRNFALGLI